MPRMQPKRRALRARGEKSRTMIKTFMPQSNQDYTARRFHTDNYDCELPPHLRSEGVAPKRPRILGQPQEPGREGILKWVVTFGLSVVILVGTIGNCNQSRSRRTTQQI